MSFLQIKFARACTCKIFFVPLPSDCVRIRFYKENCMEEDIRHSGVVLSTDGLMARIEILQTSACAECKAKSMCMSSESQSKLIDAVMTEPMQPGDKVEVVVRERLAWKAVLLGYILPFLIMIAVIALLDLLTPWSEAIVGTTSLCAIAAYYLILRLFRNKLQKQFSIPVR